MARGSKYASNLYARGTIARTQLPDQIRCSNCRKSKGPAAFSEKSRQTIQAIVDKYGPAAVGPKSDGPCRCTACNAPRSEKKCNSCDKTKSIDKYNSTQAKNDEGICEECCRIRDAELAREPDDETEEAEQGSDSFEESSSDDEVSTLTDNYSRISHWDVPDTPSTRAAGVAVPPSPQVTPARSTTTASSSRNQGVFLNSPSPRSITGSAISRTATNSTAGGYARTTRGAVGSITSTSVATTSTVGNGIVVKSSASFAKAPAGANTVTPRKVSQNGGVGEFNLDEVAVSADSDSGEDDD